MVCGTVSVAHSKLYTRIGTMTDFGLGVSLDLALVPQDPVE